MKKLFALFLAGAMLFCAGCSETSPIDDTPVGAGGTAASPSENSTSSQEEDGTLGKTLLYRSYAYKENEAFPIDYEFTAENIQIFDNYQQSGLPKEEFMEEYTTDQPFILLDLTIKKTSGPKREEVPYEDTIELLKLANREMQDAEKSGRQPVFFPVPCYFSGHSQEGYYTYWLEPGKEKTYQVGWCLSAPGDTGKENTVNLTNTQGLALYLGLEEGLNGDCIELTQ